MILFHISRINSGDLRLWDRALLPACLLRRAGLQVKIIAGALRPRDLRGARTIVLTGAFGPETELYCQQARGAGLRVLLDIGDANALDGGPALRAAALADGLTTANARLCAIAERKIGPSAPPVVVLPSPVARAISLRDPMAFPTIGFRILAHALAIRAVDQARQWRRRLLGDRTPAKRGPLIVWLGDAGDLNGAGGLGELLLAAAALTDVAEDLPFRLRVVGASRWQFRHTIARLPIAAEFRRLTLATLAHDFEGTDLCFLPGPAEDSRASIAQRLGVPVLASSPVAESWESRLRAALAAAGRAAGGRIDVAPAAEDPILPAWKATLTGAAERVASHAKMPASPQARRVRVLFLLQQFQDLDLICPVVEAAIACGDFDVRVAILTKIAVPASRRLERIRHGSAAISFLRGKDVEAGRTGLSAGSVDVVVTASDGAGAGARHAVSFVRAANAIGAATLNLQHGLDNTGLSYGAANPHKDGQFASRFVLTWGGIDRLTRAASDDTRAKVIPVGCTKQKLSREAAPPFPANGRAIVAVFENLHWLRYDDAYRRRFVADLMAAAAAAPDLLFVLKPHMGGRWFTQTQAGQALPANLVVANPDAAPWRRLTADGFLVRAAAAITTPSTIALDAARYDLPTALVAYGIEADNYRPLPRIERSEDWNDFIGQIRGGRFDMAPVRGFRDAAMLPGDAVARCLRVIGLAGAGRSRSEIVADLSAPKVDRPQSCE